MASQDVSIEVIEVETLAVEQMGFPLEKLERGFLRYRMLWMLRDNEWFRYSLDGNKILLEGWVVTRTVHTLLKEYGVLESYNITWGAYKIPLNIIMVFEYVDVQDLPMSLETGWGPAFIVAEKTLKAFWRMLGDREAEKGVGAGVRLLYHCLVDRRIMPELKLSEFATWSGEDILTLVSSWDGLAPGHLWSRFTAGEAGFHEGLDNSIIEVAPGDVRRIGVMSEEARQEVEAEPVKPRGLLGNRANEMRTGSPELAEASVVRNDMDERMRRGVGGKRRRNRRRAKQVKSRRMDQAPKKLTKEQEMEIMRLLVLGVCPDASEAHIRRNQNEYYGRRKSPEVDGGEMMEEMMENGYGSEPGQLPLSEEDKEDIRSLVSPGKVSSTMDHDGSFESFVSMITNSSMKSPRGETSMMGPSLRSSPSPSPPLPSLVASSSSSSGSPSSGASAPAKRVKVNLSVSSSWSDMPSLEASPIMAKTLGKKKVVTISTESEGGDVLDRKEEWERVKKMTLYELQRSNFLVYCDDALLIGHDKVELEEEEE